jgi:hypothetical protein
VLPGAFPNRDRGEISLDLAIAYFSSKNKQELFVSSVLAPGYFQVVKISCREMKFEPQYFLVPFVGILQSVWYEQCQIYWL